MKKVLLIVCCFVVASCHKREEQKSDAILASPGFKEPDPLALMLAPHAGEGRLDAQIRQLQDQIRSRHDIGTKVEELGWLYVAKARESFDAGYYKLAEQCAVWLERKDPHAPEALFLRGHVLHNLHRFKEAEELANDVIARRGMPADFGLLGDALMEQGKLEEAAGAYQDMADLKPDLHAMVRAAHLRWLKGDLAGAIELAQDAAKSVSPRDADTAAWVLTRLATYEFQSGAVAAARVACTESESLRAEYPPTLLLRGRMLLAEGNSAEALAVLKKAAALVPLPEYLWNLIEALQANGELVEARRVESELRRTGVLSDPRTLALFLATRGEDSRLSLRLAEEELENRQDIFSYDALAWALAAVGRIEDARNRMTKALREGTQDARLFFHAAVLADRATDPVESAKWAGKAAALKHLLLPSEREQLSRLAASQFPNQSIGLAGAEK
ncbi:MAG TPA: tetratricopeptide repeat protein [Candidatus Limnocylindrales bacterium]|nr:tetratricopeptide repeat protein [Candidatus Limnocylindrales bacterium]